MSIESLLEHCGLLAVALGAGLEGETAVVAGGLLAHRGYFPVWAAALCATLGSFTADQGFFWIGRRCRDHGWVRRIQQRPAFARALAAFERRPTAFILGFRFVYGIRIASPIAIGTSRVAARRFLLLNALAAAIWAPLFTAIGYGGGQLLKRLFPGLHLPLWAIGAAVLAVVALGVAVHWLLSRRAPPSPRSP